MLEPPQQFTDASNATEDTGMSKHRLSPYIAYYLKRLNYKTVQLPIPVQARDVSQSVNGITINVPRPLSG